MEQIVFDPEALKSSLETIVKSVIVNVLPLDFLLGLLAFGYKIVYNGIRSLMGI